MNCYLSSRQLRFLIVMILLPSSLFSCGSLKSGFYENWDADNNGQLNKYEFISGYLESNYFNLVSKGKTSVTYSEMNDAMFQQVDMNRDSSIEKKEFSTRIMLVDPREKSDLTFDQWDTSRDGVVDMKEFHDKTTSDSISTRWDLDPKDGVITAREYAGNIFSLFDRDLNGSIDPVEFNVWKMMR